MYYGKETAELNDLRKQYEEVFGYDPNGEMELEYSENDYEDYIRDLKKAIKAKRHLADFVE